MVKFFHLSSKRYCPQPDDKSNKQFGLLGGKATIYRQRQAVGEGSRVGTEPEDGAGHFVGLPQAAHRVDVDGGFQKLG